MIKTTPTIKTTPRMKTAAKMKTTLKVKKRRGHRVDELPFGTIFLFAGLS